MPDQHGVQAKLRQGRSEADERQREVEDAESGGGQVPGYGRERDHGHGAPHNALSDDPGHEMGRASVGRRVHASSHGITRSRTASGSTARRQRGSGNRQLSKHGL